MDEDGSQEVRTLLVSSLVIIHVSSGLPTFTSVYVPSLPHTAVPCGWSEWGSVHRLTGLKEAAS